MDTENLVKVQINSFIKGMDTDTAYELVDNGSYTIAKNIRVFSLNENGQSYNTNSYGQIKAIEGVGNSVDCNLDSFTYNDQKVFNDPKDIQIIATNNIRNYGIIIIKFTESENKCFAIIRFENTISNDNDCNFQLVCKVNKPLGNPEEELKKVCTVTRYENDKYIKLYIADGYHNILVINIMNEYGILDDFSQIESINKSIFESPILNGFINGNLKAGLVQYSYRLYNKNGISTDVSVPTKLIPIVNKPTNANGKSICGDDKDQNVGVGVKLRIHIPTNVQFMDRMILYRITYIENGQSPNIEAIYDDVTIPENEYVDIADYGQTALSELTLEEYNSITGIHIIPKVIESKNDYLFAANIKEEDYDHSFDDFDPRSYRFNLSGNAYLYDCNDVENPQYVLNKNNSQWDSISKNSDCYNIYNDMSKQYTYNIDNQDNGQNCRFDKDGYYGGSGKYINWRFVIIELDGDDSKFETQTNNGEIGFSSNIIKLDNTQNLDSSVLCSYVNKDGLDYNNQKNIDFSKYYVSGCSKGYNYSNPIVSYAFKSLKRDELYRYGIVLYGKNGKKSAVKWICDIRTPDSSTPGFETFCSNRMINDTEAIDLKVRPLGIEFTVDIDKYNSEHEDDYKIEHYEIVRCNRNENDIHNITQGIISRPVQRQFNNTATSVNIVGQPFIPTGIMSTANYWVGQKWRARNQSISNQDYDGYEADNYENRSLYQFVSPEILYQKNSTLDLLQKSNIYLTPINYIFGQNNSFDPYKQVFKIDIPTDHFIADNYFLSFNEYQFTFASTAYSNLNKPLGVYVDPEDGDYSGYQVCVGNSDELLGTIGCKSVFDYIKTTIPQYYVAEPSETIMNKNFTATWYSVGTDFYNKENNKHSYQVSDRNYNNVSKELFSYSKLYEQCYDLLFRVYDEESYHNRVVGDPNKYEKGRLNYNNTYKYEIGDVKMADEIKWDEFLQLTDNNKIQYKYTDFSTSIGSNSFCNFMCGGLYNEQTVLGTEDSSNNIVGSGLNDLSNGGLSDQMFGPGGRSLLVYIKDTNNILYKTIGATTIKYFSKRLNDTSYNKINNYNLLERYSANIGTTISKYEKMSEELNSETIYLNSILGTYICNIQQDTVPYNGYDYISRTLDSYYSYGDLFTSDEKCNVIFDGDCFIMPMEYVSLHKYYFPKIKSPTTTMIAYSIPVETNINLAYTYGNEYSRNYKDSGISNLQIEPSNVNNYYVQTDPLYNYNSVYSSNNYTKVYEHETNINEENIDDIDYRCHNSNVKLNNESIDSWTKFQPADYIDVDTRFGPITNMRNFNNRLIFWQENAIGQLSVNERSQIIDSNNQSLILGTGGVLDRYDYYDQTSGMHEQQYCDTQSDSYLYWYDDHNHELKMFSGGQILQLNKQYKTQNIMHKNNANIDVDRTCMFYDNYYNELISKVLKNNESIIYSEQNKIFTSICTIPFENYVKFKNGIYVLKSKEGGVKISQWNKKYYDGKEYSCRDIDGNPIYTYIQYVVNDQPLYTKIFDNQEIVSNDLSINKNYFSNSHEYSWYTELNNTNTNELKITDREGNFRYSIPRSINNEGNINKFGNRIKGKYMICDIQNNNVKQNASLSYILTKYRISWA